MRTPATLNVVLLDPGPYKVQVVQAIRDLTGAGLREAADLTRTGGTVLHGVADAVARAAQARLEVLGARVSIE